jgi:hypothetical protein
MRKQLLVAVALLAALLQACTNDVAPQEQSLQLKFEHKFGHPSVDSLFPIFPNPYSHAAGDTAVVIRFTLRDSTTDAHLLIQNVIGDEIANYTDSVLAPGTYSGSWNPIASDGTPLKAGLYFITLRSTTYINSRLVSIQDNE